MAPDHSLPAPDLTLVVPTYNESERLETLVGQIFAACEGRVRVEVVVVDDNSPDGTGARADSLAATRRVKVIHRSGKLGLGSAVIEGFNAASADVVGAIDADLSHPPELVPQLYAALVERQLDMVVASRYVPGGGSDGFALSRRLMSRAACWLSQPLTPVRDAMSGFFLIRRDRLAGLRPSGRGFKIALELLVRARLRSVGEMPYTFAGRTAGQSKMSAGEAFIFLRQVLALSALPTRTKPAEIEYHLLAPAPSDLRQTIGHPAKNNAATIN